MSIVTSIKKIFNWIKPVLNEYGILILILFTEFILLRFFEFIYLKASFKFSFSYFLYEIKGVYYDFLFVSLIATALFIPFIILFKLKKKASRVIFYIINSVIIITSIALIDYLKYNFCPLDHAIFAYPVNELLYIVNKSVELNLLLFVKYFLALAIVIFITRLFLEKLKSGKLYIVGLVFILSGILLTKNLNPPRRNFSNETRYNLCLNKVSFFTKSCAKYLLGNEEINALEFNKIARNYQTIHPEFEFINLNYPLEHKPDTNDVLGSFFNLNDDPPNIVFVIMESLSSAFCGSNAYLGSFTPFLDSLINEGLYWENFLSTSERTFNTFPSILGSLPYGKKGFMHLIQDDFTVNHTSLIQWLAQYGYSSHFYYGGWTAFDNMSRFFKYQDIDFILEYFSKDYLKIENDKTGFSWGYPDKSLYMRSFETLDSLNNNPRIDIYLTLSFHHPFRPPNKEHYDSLFEKRMNYLKMNEQEKQKTRVYSEVFATALYTDDALKYFIDEYKKREEFENTIFIITGDHRLGTQNIKNQIDLYHVPFIIYSPMIKKSVKFSSISSHANISPSLYTFFSKNYKFEMPEKVHWLAQQIDTCRNFRNIHIVPFMRTNREITDYLSNNYFLSGNDLFEIKNNLDLFRIENQILFDSLNKNLKNFQILNRHITQNNLIISDD